MSDQHVQENNCYIPVVFERGIYFSLIYNGGMHCETG